MAFLANFAENKYLIRKEYVKWIIKQTDVI